MHTMDISTEPLVQTSSDDDSDVDLVTDFLNSNPITKHAVETASHCSLKQKQPKGLSLNCSLRPELNNFQQQQHQLNAINTASNTIAGNMVPIISVTPHSPGTKYNSILEDTISQLQNIRESVVHMKNSTVQKQSYGTCGLISSSLNSSRIFSSCPSLPDLTAAVNANNSLWSPPQSLQNSDRRKSWTGAEDLTDCTKSSHKSVSLSSLDSEEQESIRVAERLHSRSSRNSTGGISTHSLNEAELARDFERITAKRNLVPLVINRIPLQKSISTPSIAPIRKPGQKEDNNITASRHLSDSEDQDDRSLLSARDKIEVYADHPEKRRKRGSLFFRKKKDKTKTKGQSTTCDACGAVINLSTCKEHAIECKGKPSKQQSSKSGSGKKGSTNSGKKMTGCYSPWRLVANKLGVTSHHASHTSSHHDDGRDYYDGHNQHDHINYSDDTPLIRGEFLNDPPIGPHDLGADPIWGIAVDEPDSWSPSVAKEIVKSLKDKQVKRQEHIYEFIMTEKHHCQTLLVMKKVFIESLQRHFSRLKLDKLFPRLPELTELHTNFLKKLRLKQKESPIVDSIADILLDFFAGPTAQKLKSAYGEFCSNHRSALDTFKMYMTDDQTFAEWYKHCQQNPLLKKKGIPECILFVTQRLTKYPLLIDPLLKSSREDRVEHEKLQKAMALVKGILIDVDARVAEKEKEDRQLEIFKCIDVKSFAMYKSKQFRKSDLWANRKLKFEGYATLMQGRSKMQNVLVVVLTDCLFFLQESSHNKYTFFTPENKAGVVSLQKLLIREKAGTESRGIYIISSNPAYPEMYELKVQNPKDKNVWIQSIRAAVLECPIDDDHETDDLTAEEKQKLIDAKQATMRELIYKMRQKDIEQAIMLEEKILLQLSLLNEMKGSAEASSANAEEFLANFGTYKDLITDNYCDTVEIWKRVLNTVQEIGQLASSLYTAATGLPVSRSFSSVGERQSECYTSPILPKRAETFGGFDERRNKSNIPWRDAVLSTLPMAPMPTKDNHFYQANDKRDSIASECDTNSNTLSVYQNNLRVQSENISLKDHNYAALQVSHHLHTLLCIISQQMTTINSLRAQLASFRDNPKTIYKHNDQLEELRNLQDKLQEEKQAWLKQKEQQERELEEQRNSQLAIEKQIKADQEDIRQQREQLYRKMEMLYSQGLLLSPNTPLSIANVSPNTDIDNSPHSSDEHHHGHGTLSDKRNEKWRSASISKAPPANLLSATNAPKINQANIKQQIPMKLSSLSSTKSDKSPNSSNSNNSPINPSGGITQMFPLKLADKKNQNITPNHSRTGSSPAIIQQPIQQQSGNPATRTNTYPKLPERYRVRSSDVGLPLHPQLQTQHSTPTPGTTSLLASNAGTHAMKATVHYGTAPGPLNSQSTTIGTPTMTKKTISPSANRPPTNSNDKSATPNPEEEEIYF